MQRRLCPATALGSLVCKARHLHGSRGLNKLLTGHSKQKFAQGEDPCVLSIGQPVAPGIMTSRPPPPDPNLAND